jgi:hypothetical protein
MTKILILLTILIIGTSSFDLNEFYKKELSKISKIILADLIIIIKEQLENTTNIE